MFAVALTLLVLDIKLPESNVPMTHDELVTNLIALGRHFVIYVISFVVIGMYWINHHIQFHFVERTTRVLIWINLLYLLLVSFLPFATDLIGDHKELVLPCEIYGLALLALSATSFCHVTYIAHHRELATPDFSDDIARLIKRRVAIFAIVALLSMAVAYHDTHAALYVYLLLVTAHFFPGRIDRRLARPEGEGLTT